MNQSIWTWVVVADANGARIMRFGKRTEPWQQVEHLRTDGLGGQQTADFAAKASQHKGALHGHGEVTPKDTKERHLARAIVHALERGMVDNLFGALVLVAAPKLLGELRENLSRGLQERILAELPKDLVHEDATELARRLLPDLPPHIV
jgi:protein required for attachment to host cells